MFHLEREPRDNLLIFLIHALALVKANSFCYCENYWDCDDSECVNFVFFTVVITTRRDYTRLWIDDVFSFLFISR
jgi:hypothetical protein